jgi:hypothetical protein
MSGVFTVMKDEGLFDPSGLGVSRAVGAFLPSIIAIILGLWLVNDAPKR